MCFHVHMSMYLKGCVQGNIANTLCNQGKLPEAFALLSEVLTIFEQIYGSGHPLVADTQSKCLPPSAATAPAAEAAQAQAPSSPQFSPGERVQARRHGRGVFLRGTVQGPGESALAAL